MEILSAVEVAERLGVAHSTVRLWCNQGRFKTAKRIGREWALLDSDLKGFQRPKRGQPVGTKRKKTSAGELESA